MKIILIFTYLILFVIGFFIGYFWRKIIFQKKKDSLEKRLEADLLASKEKAEKIISEARKKANRISENLERSYERKRNEILKAEQILLKRENILREKFSDLEKREAEFNEKIGKLKEIKDNLLKERESIQKRLEKIANISKKEAKDQLFKEIEKEFKQDILKRIRKLEEEGAEKYRERAKSILAQAIQKFALSQAQELTTTTVSLPSDEIKGRIIGKEGRNIRTFEKLTGVELIVDETPGIVMISSFNPIRRELARIALEKLIKDSRIQPARIEEKVKEAERELSEKIKESGEKAAYETGVIDLPPKLVELLGRLYFRTSYGQNVLLHSMEVAILAQNIAEEIGANVKVARKAGLLHDIGKALDREVQGSHVDIGIKILERFNIEKEVIQAMKSHHDEYPPETIEAIIVKVADQISGARPGARKDTLENYLQRLTDLEEIALSFPEVEKAYAIQAGREIRVFVKPEEVDDLGAKKLAKQIADRIEENLTYPGEIKVTVIRESRVIEYAK